MSGVNKVILVGHLGKDPEVRHLESGNTVVRFTLATSETYTKDGRRIEQTEWHNIVVWRALADNAARFLQKGKLVYIEGKLRTRSYEDKEGNKKYSTEVVADNFVMLGRKGDFEGSSMPATGIPASPENQSADLNPEENSKEDDLPF